MRKPKDRSNEGIIAFTSTYNPNNPNIENEIRDSIEKIKKAKPENSTFRKSKLVNSKRQPPSLERLLCKSEYIHPNNYGVTKCGKNCVCCSYIGECKEIKFKNREEKFKLKSRFNCDSTNLIYLLICNGCGEEYIGETSRTLRERVSLYKSRIGDPNLGTIFVEKYVRSCGKEQFSISPFYQMRNNNLNTRRAHESAFIDDFKPKLNRKS